MISRDTRADHALPSTEPLLWIPDVVAGACRAAHDGLAEYRALLEPLITEHLIDLTPQ